MRFQQDVTGVGSWATGLEIRERVGGPHEVSFRIYENVPESVTVPEVGDTVTATLTTLNAPRDRNGSVSVTARVTRVTQGYGPAGWYYGVEAQSTVVDLANQRYWWTEEDTEDLREDSGEPAGPPWERMPSSLEEERIDLADVVADVAGESGFTVETPAEALVSSHASNGDTVLDLVGEYVDKAGLLWRQNGTTVEVAESWGEAVSLDYMDFAEGTLSIEESSDDLYNEVTGIGYEYKVMTSTSPRLPVRHNCFDVLDNGGEKYGYLESFAIDEWRVDIGEEWEAWDKVYITNVTAATPIVGADLSPGREESRKLLQRLIDRAEKSDKPADQIYLEGTYQEDEKVVRLEGTYRVWSERRSIAEGAPFNPRGRLVYDSGSLYSSRLEEVDGPYMFGEQVVETDERIERNTKALSQGGYYVTNRDLSGWGPLRLEAKIPVRRPVRLVKRDASSIQTYGLRMGPEEDNPNKDPLDVMEDRLERVVSQHAQPRRSVEGSLLRGDIVAGQKISVAGVEAVAEEVSWTVSGNVLEIKLTATEQA